MSLSTPDDDGLRWREAGADELSVLAELNRQLIADEGHANPMDRSGLETRMRAWLDGPYRAVLFELGRAVVGYVCFRPDARGVYLRQFFICRSHRRRGFGRRAMALLVDQILERGTEVSIDVLARNEVGAAFWRAVGFEAYSVRMRRASRAVSGAGGSGGPPGPRTEETDGLSEG